MELDKLKKDELNSYELPRLKETEQEIRLELAKIRLDVFSDKKQHIGKVRNLKKNLARVLTFKHALNQNSAQQ